MKKKKRLLTEKKNAFIMYLHLTHFPHTYIEDYNKKKKNLSSFFQRIIFGKIILFIQYFFYRSFYQAIFAVTFIVNHCLQNICDWFYRIFQFHFFNNKMFCSNVISFMDFYFMILYSSYILYDDNYNNLSFDFDQKKRKIDKQ